MMVSLLLDTAPISLKRFRDNGCSTSNKVAAMAYCIMQLLDSGLLYLQAAYPSLMHHVYLIMSSLQTWC